jgi:hypothetical protein
MITIHNRSFKSPSLPKIPACSNFLIKNVNYAMAAEKLSFFCSFFPWVRTALFLLFRSLVHITIKSLLYFISFCLYFNLKGPKHEIFESGFFT